MSIIVAWCFAGLTPSTCSASPRAPPTPGRESLPTSRMKNGALGPRATRSAAESGAIFDAQVRGSRRDRHVHTREPRREDPDATEDERGRRSRERQQHALLIRRPRRRYRLGAVDRTGLVAGTVRRYDESSRCRTSCRGRGRGSRRRLADRLHAVRGDVPRAARLGERQLDVALDPQRPESPVPLMVRSKIGADVHEIAERAFEGREVDRGRVERLRDLPDRDVGQRGLVGPGRGAFSPVSKSAGYDAATLPVLSGEKTASSM